MGYKYLIVVGDSTTAGGEAIEGDPGFIIQGLDGVHRPLVRVNDAVMCGQCGPTNVAQGVAFFFSDGAMAAYDGCLLACGHQMVSTMQRLHSVEVADAPRRAATPACAQSAAQTSHTAATRFDEGFQFIDSATGKPLVGLDCMLLPENASQMVGKLGESGCSPRCVDDKPDRIAAAVEASSPLLL